MKPTTFSIKTRQLICKLFNHRFKTTRNITEHFKEYECKCCKKQMTNDPMGRQIVLTQEHREINEALSLIFQRKQSAVA
jgi:hypothetical protein